MNRNADAIQEPLIVMRGDRYCIPVRSDNRNAVPGILHERSGSGASFFIEPMQAIELNNDLADLLIQEREEIARITRFVSADDLRAAPRSSTRLVAGELDALQACAVFHDADPRNAADVHRDRELHTSTDAIPCSTSASPQRARRHSAKTKAAQGRPVPISQRSS